MKYEEDDRAARGLWAPGKYLNRCDTCRELFVGAKLCMQTFECPTCERVVLGDDPIRSHIAWLNSSELRPPE
jgi:hypothetical protein